MPHYNYILRFVGHFGIIYKENMWKRYFQIRGGIILLLGASVKSKFDGLQSRNLDFHDFQILGTSGNSYLMASLDGIS